jgi:hypothetical protein
MGGDTNGPPIGCLLCPLLYVFADGKTMMVSNEVRLQILFLMDCGCVTFGKWIMCWLLRERDMTNRKR